MKVYNTLEFPFGKLNYSEDINDFCREYPYMYSVVTKTETSVKLYFAFISIEEYNSLPLEKKITSTMETFNYFQLFKLM